MRKKTIKLVEIEEDFCDKCHILLKGDVNSYISGCSYVESYIMAGEYEILNQIESMELCNNCRIIFEKTYHPGIWSYINDKIKEFIQPD